MTKFKDFLAEQLNNPELCAEYDALKEEFELAQARIDSSKLQNKDK